MNAIFIHDLRVETRIGVYEREQQLAQTIRLDIELGLPSDNVFRSGDFADARNHYTAAPDGQSFLVNVIEETVDHASITVMVNWTPR